MEEGKMNKGSILLFLFVFGVASSGQAVAQPSNGSSAEGLKITKEHQQFVAKKRPESKVKCPKGAQPPDCVSLKNPDH